MDKVDEVHEEVVRYFINNLKKIFLDKENFDEVDFQTITHIDQDVICSPFTLYEIDILVAQI